MRVLRGIGMLATCGEGGGQGDIHPIHDAALAWDGRVVRWAGPAGALPAELRNAPSDDAGGRLVVPGLVDCHTHLAFGGWRAGEFERRVRGDSYLDIARDGGGIASTMRATRAASEDALVARALGFLQDMLRLGVTTVECKSGYGLDTRTELTLLRAYRRLGSLQPARIVPTFLGAHTIPPEHRADRRRYLDLVIGDMLPAIREEGLARFCDVFVEETAFSVEEGREVLLAGKAAGLGAKVHADQLTSSGGAELAAEVGGISADHLECITERGIAAMAGAGVTAVSLPIASLYLGQRPMPARRLIDAGVPVAVATDFNPGSAPSYHLPLAMTLACTMQRMTPAEALKGATVIAARAIGLESECGSLEVGKAADFCVIDAPDVNTWLYHFRPNACVRTVIGGVTAWAAAASGGPDTG
jgi:imidazolonepropionase